jgi:2-aminoethylphosphonate transport system ATP-binding protein
MATNSTTMSQGPHMRVSAPASRIVPGASGIGFENVSVAYGDQVILDALNLTVKPGEIVALIGPSGSGKTTALRAVAGFVQPTAGRIIIGDRDVTRLPPYERNIGMVVQNYALFPHMRVEDNVAFGLRARGASAEVIRERIPECLRLVGMTAYGKRYPRELSGGQQQRVAIARALAIRPQVLLLDEPLSALDAQIRRSMLDELAKLHRDLPSLTVLYVTHDQTEALTLADHIGIMRDGKLVAFGNAQSLYCHPPNRFAAEFLGRANILPARSLQSADLGFACVRFGDTLLRGRNHHSLPDGSDSLVCIRPHDLRSP